MSERRGLGAAVGFLTPVGGAVTPSPEALDWFPVVGAALGGTLGAGWVLARRRWPPGVAAALVVAADLALTGMLHFDGLVDSADGLIAHLDRARRLEVMTTPDIGAFGLAVGSTTLLVRWSALAALEPAPLLLAGLWSMSRLIMAVAVQRLPYARAGGGLVSAFQSDAAGLSAVPGPPAASSTRRRAWTVMAATAFVAAAGWRRGVGPLAVISGAVTSAAVLGLGCRRLGGFTGDVLGAAGVLGETVGLVVAVRK